MSRFDTAVSEKFLMAVGFVATVVLLVSAAGLVTSHHKSRSLFNQIEKAHEEGRRLADDATQLQLDLSRAGLTAVVQSRAVKLGFEKADINTTRILEVDEKTLTKGRMEVRK